MAQTGSDTTSTTNERAAGLVLNMEPGQNKEYIYETMKQISELKEYLVAAPGNFAEGDIIRQFRLPTEEKISCVRWNGVFYITGTDIVRSLTYRFTAFGREITNRKKFEEGIFSDLRNLKINQDATLESPKSELLEFLYKHHCVRTKKKQKVFHWFSVRHDQLFVDALERELKKDVAQEVSIAGSSSPPSILSAPSTEAVREPSVSFRYNSSMPLRDQLLDATREMSQILIELVSMILQDERLPEGRMLNFIESMPHENLIGVDRRLGTPIQMNIEHLNSSMNYASNAALAEYSGSGKHITRQSDHVSSRNGAYLNTQTAHTANCSTPAIYPGAKSSALTRSRSMRGSQLPFPQEGSSEEPFLFFTDTESDFPLDYLVQEDSRNFVTVPRPESQPHASFDERYSKFAYMNRPSIRLAQAQAQIHAQTHSRLQGDAQSLQYDPTTSYIAEESALLTPRSSFSGYGSDTWNPRIFSPATSEPLLRSVKGGRIAKYPLPSPGPHHLSPLDSRYK